MPADEASPHQRWAHLRFSIIGTLLAAPPPRGELQAELAGPVEVTSSTGGAITFQGVIIPY